MAHIAKYCKSALGHMLNHYGRQENDGIKRSNEDIRSELTHNNWNLAENVQPLPQMDFIHQRLSEVKVQNRADVNVMCDWVVTVPKDLPEAEHSKFFKATFDFLMTRYGRKNIISAYVHLDETTPHMHFAFIPVVEDRKKGGFKVSAKERINREDLRSFHYELQQAVSSALGHNVSILNSATKDGNKTVSELKRKTALEKIAKAEKVEQVAQQRIQKAQEQVLKAEEMATNAEQKAQKHNNARKMLKAEKKQLQIEIEQLKIEKEMEIREKTDKLRQLNSEIGSAEKRLEALQGRILTTQEVRALPIKKTLTGAIRGISGDDILNLQKTASYVDEVKAREKGFAKWARELKEKEAEISAKEDKAKIAEEKRKSAEESIAVLESRISALVEKYNIAQELATAECSSSLIKSVTSREQIKRNADIIHKKVEKEYKEQQIKKPKGRSR